ncbi:hypothetical protein DPMN_015371 [Dreissena polymorpha]|uniref:Uncharacterized protein n=1 Tax=Dreissena polymorpha TaxID=45954 RepID=A0A9D4NB74_DREPO|nr:hypothetical protein DPMN_015371 [Dreissena polymorpha]
MAEAIWSDVDRRLRCHMVDFTEHRPTYGGSHMVFSRPTNGQSHLVDVMLSTVQRPKYGGSHMV